MQNTVPLKAPLAQTWDQGHTDGSQLKLQASCDPPLGCVSGSHISNPSPAVPGWVSWTQVMILPAWDHHWIQPPASAVSALPKPRRTALRGEGTQCTTLFPTHRTLIYSFVSPYMEVASCTL